MLRTLVVFNRLMSKKSNELLMKSHKRETRPHKTRGGSKGEGGMSVFMALPRRQLAQLKAEKRAEEKHQEMTRQLWDQEWFVQYRVELEKYRAGRGPRPVFPNKRAEELEKEVDRLMEARR